MKRSDIQVGMTVRVTSNWTETGNVPEGTVATVDQIEPPEYDGSWDVHIESGELDYGDAWVSSDILAPYPAPLDPSKVKAGDTVTVEVIPLHGPRYSLGGEVYRVDMSGPLWVGPVCITGPDEDIVRVRLTDHQPAPEPEPEWKRGTVAEASIDGYELPHERYRGLVGASTFEYLNDEGVPCFADLSRLRDVRPLVVIDPAAVDRKALEEAFVRAGGFSSNAMGIRAVLRHLGIEVQS